jgi:hypothetical protein
VPALEGEQGAGNTRGGKVQFVCELGWAAARLRAAQRNEQAQLGKAQPAHLECADGARMGRGKGKEGLDGVGRHILSILE